MKDKGGYSYDDAVKVNGVPEEYAIVEATDCDQCNRAGYEKNQGSDPHSRFAQGAFFDVIHCECKFCHHRRNFVFDITGLPKFQGIIQMAQANFEGPDVLQQVGEWYNEKYRNGLSIELKPAAPPPDPPKESASSYQYLPLIFALEHLRIRFNRSGDIAREICLVQGTCDIPAASDEQIDAWWRLNQYPGGTIPHDIELQLLTAACSGWPEEASIAFAGICSFGAGDLKRAAACARHAILQNPQCTLARQLVKLLTAKGDPRKPFGVEVKDVPDVVQMLSE